MIQMFCLQGVANQRQIGEGKKIERLRQLVLDNRTYDDYELIERNPRI